MTRTKHWPDIARLDNAVEAKAAISRVVAECETPSDAVELVGAHLAREWTRENGWHEPIPPAVRQAWNERVTDRAFIRWEYIARERLMEDEVQRAAEAVERRLEASGIRATRTARAMLADHLHVRF